MDFNELLSMAIGLQTSGIIGHGKLFLTSRKFIPAEGGIKRVVWMSKNIKEELANELKEAFEREGVPELGDKIADGDIATTIDELLAFLEERKHPALDMSPII
jgi:acetyl-CoA synthase